MKVKRLIEELSKMNPNASVRIANEYGSPVMFVLSYLNNENVVWLESMDDCNMRDQIRSRILTSNINMEPEKVLFEDFLDHDITPDILRENYCNESTIKHFEYYLNAVRGSFT